MLGVGQNGCMDHMSSQDRLRALAALVTTVVLWGSAFIGIRVAVASYTPGQFSFARVFIASLALGVIVAFRGGIRFPARRDLPAFFLLGASAQCVYQLLLNTGERTVDGGTAALLISMAPILASVAAVAFLGEKLSGMGWLGTAVAFAGACVIALGAGASMHMSTGVLMIAAATCVWAFYLVTQKTLADRYDSFELTAWPLWIGSILLLPFAGGLPHALVTAPFAATASLVFVAIGSSVLGFLAWAYAIQRLPVTVATSALFTVPVAALLTSLAFLREVPATASLAGAALAFTGVIIVQVSGRVRAFRAARGADALEVEVEAEA
jgi:drug/metabolite transporter (DMT)-like permease